MGKKAKSSRKGKKAWRANIPTDDIEEFFVKSTKDALSGGSVANVSNDSLFIVDKSRGSLNSETLTHLSPSFLGFFFLFHFLSSHLWRSQPSSLDDSLSSSLVVDRLDVQRMSFD